MESVRLKAFYWEGEKESRVSQTGKQLQIVVIFARTQEEAVQFFYEKEGGEGNTIRECLDELLEFTEPLELSPGMGELALTLLYTFNSSSKLYQEQHLKDQGITTSIHKFYRYTPNRILYLLAKTEETKKKPKAVKTIELDELD